MDPLSAAVAVLALAVLAWDRAQARKERENTERLHRTERQELANRIQHPNLVPMPERKAKPTVRRPSDAQALAQVGTIQAPKDPA